MKEKSKNLIYQEDSFVNSPSSVVSPSNGGSVNLASFLSGEQKEELRNGFEETKNNEVEEAKVDQIKANVNEVLDKLTE